MNIKNMKGFTGLEIVLTIALTAVLVGGGVYVYMQRSQAPSASSQTKTSSTPKEVTKTLNLKEMGVQLTLPKGLEDLKYKFTQEGGPTSSFTTASLEKAAKGTKNPLDSSQTEICSYGAIGSIGKTEEPQEPGPYSIESRKVGASYYTLYSMPDGGPCSDDKQAEELSVKQHTLLKDAFKSLKEIE